jgi:hypothetical protein
MITYIFGLQDLAFRPFSPLYDLCDRHRSASLIPSGPAWKCRMIRVLFYAYGISRRISALMFSHLAHSPLRKERRAVRER